MITEVWACSYRLASDPKHTLRVHVIGESYEGARRWFSHPSIKGVTDKIDVVGKIWDLMLITAKK